MLSLCIHCLSSSKCIRHKSRGGKSGESWLCSINTSWRGDDHSIWHISSVCDCW